MESSVDGVGFRPYMEGHLAPSPVSIEIGPSPCILITYANLTKLLWNIKVNSKYLKHSHTDVRVFEVLFLLIGETLFLYLKCCAIFLIPLFPH